jgi:WD40 repeat protein
MLQHQLSCVLVALFVLQGACHADDLFSYRDKRAPVQRITFSPDGQFLAIGNAKGDIHLFEARTGKAISHLLLQDNWPVQGLTFSKDSRTLIAGYHIIKKWSVPHGKLIHEWPKQAAQVTAISLDMGRFCQSFANGTVQVCDLQKRERVTTFKGHKMPCYETSFAPNPAYLVTAGWDHAVKVWDVEKGLELASFSGHKYWLSSVTWSPDGTQIATSSWDGIRLLDLKTKQLQCTLRTPHAFAFASVVYSPNGSKIVAGAKDGEVVLWHRRTAKQLGWLRPHKDIVWSLAFSPDGSLLASVSEDHLLHVWKAPAFCKEAAANMKEQK